MFTSNYSEKVFNGRTATHACEKRVGEDTRGELARSLDGGGVVGCAQKGEGGATRGRAPLGGILNDGYTI